MSSWSDFEQDVPQFAAFGKSRLQSGVAYLGTIRADGSPRVHPVTPIIAKHLFLFMEPTSPKGKDLMRDPRYTLHCAVEDSSGGAGEFYVRGRAALISDSLIREQAVQAASFSPEERYILFMLSVEFAFMNIYSEEGPTLNRWRSPDKDAASRNE